MGCIGSGISFGPFMMDMGLGVGTCVFTGVATSSETSSEGMLLIWIESVER